jgi:tetratricopeptide (TPR) repeat protein
MMGYKAVSNRKIFLFLLVTLFLLNVTADAEELRIDVSIDINDAISYMEEIVDIEPDVYKTRFVLGLMYFDLGTAKFDMNTNALSQYNQEYILKAQKHFIKALELTSNYSLIYYYLGLIEILNGFNAEKAIEYLKESTKNTRSDHRPYWMLNFIYMSKEQYNESIKILELAREELQPYVQIYHALSVSYLMVNDIEKTIENAKKALAIKDNPETRIVLASAYFISNDFVNANKQYRDILEKDPWNLNALLGLASLLIKQNDIKQARDILNKAKKHYPDDSEVNKLLSDLAVDRTE